MICRKDKFMILYIDVHFVIGRNPNKKKDWRYICFSWSAWLGAVYFFAYNSRPEWGGECFLSVLRVIVPLLFAYPVYTIGRSLRSQWREKAVYIWDVFLLLFFVAVALLVATGQLYVRQEWLDAFFDRR